MDTAASYSGGTNPGAFSAMPRLEEAEVVRELGGRISFSTGDRKGAFLGDGSVDVIFACNALPREKVPDETRHELVSTLENWIRLLNPQGLLYIHMHNGYDVVRETRKILQSMGLREVFVDPYPGENRLGPPGKGTGAHFQVYGSSG